MHTQWLFPTPYCLFVRLEIRRERYNLFKELASKVAFAYQQHSQRMRWMAYATVAGPANVVYVMLPMPELADMDRMPSLDQVLHAVHGDEGGPILEKFQDCVLHMESFVLNRLNDNIEPTEREKPPPYLYYLALKPQPPRMGQLMENLQQLGAATTGAPLFCYATFAGPIRLHVFTMGETIAQLGEIAALERRVTEHHGKDAGREVLARIHESLDDIDVAILRYIGHLD
jgi:hypothetical protein